MNCLPEAYKNIIVGLKWKSKFTWYVSEKDMWFLDQTILQNEYEKWCKEKGLPLDFGVSKDDTRYDFLVLSEKNIDSFLPRITDYISPVDELRDYLKLAMELKPPIDVFYEYMPSLLIDFDQEVLYSMYSEPASFEAYVPTHWKGYYQDFLDLIEPSERFWYENGKAVFDFKKEPTDI